MADNPRAQDRREQQIEAHQPGRGRLAETPLEIPARGWRDIAWRVFAEISEDRIFLIAAGATFYLLLALFPALTAFVSLYGFVADPKTIADHIAFLGGVLPAGGYELIRDQLKALTAQNEEALSWGFVAGLAVSIWSANNGIKSLFEGLNVAYGEREKRSFIVVNLISLTFTAGAMFVGIALIFSVGVVPAVLAFLMLDHWTELLISALRWPILLVVVGAGICLIFRYGPSRERAKWRWITSGAAIATVVWLVASWGFSLYLQNFANYNATYGSLGAVIGFMMWTWISVVILLVGAELNAEMEHQTARDSTTGAPQPLGERGAVMADTIGRAAGDDH
ncbi:YihY/virulence factor BrkB family protein [Mesorhizobium sp. CN2-181]|uniref:YihY/virulence factor BrkB family protein n=1 Tax=Mesorhizobium yinganensis TaxID=3157707 RepID=UPI0032B7F805